MEKSGFKGDLYVYSFHIAFLPLLFFFQFCQITMAIFILRREAFHWSTILNYVLAHLLGAFLGVYTLSLVASVPPSTFAPLGSLDGKSLCYMFVGGTSLVACFLSLTDMVYIEGFLYPPLVSGSLYLGLLGACDPVMAGLLNPAVIVALIIFAPEALPGMLVKVVSSVLLSK